MVTQTLSVGAFLLGCNAGGAKVDDSSCYPIEAYEVNVRQHCFKPTALLEGVCLFEEAPDETSGASTSACLQASDGTAYVIDNYGYTQNLQGDGWEAFWLDQQTALQDNEHEAGENVTAPPACETGEELLDMAYQACRSAIADAGDCGGGFGRFSRNLVRHLPLCE